MALRADRVLSPSLAVLHNTTRKASPVSEKSALTTELMPTVTPEQISNGLGIPLSLLLSSPQVIDLDDLIGDLKDIAKNRGKHTIGFHESEQSERNRILSNTAQGLSELLIEQYENPDERTAIKAYNFVKVFKLITVLEDVTKKRGSNFGFKSSVPKEDILLSQRADKQIELLIKTPGKASLGKAEQFLENYQLICDLEGVAEKRLNNSPFGFAETEHNKERDLEIANKALEYAKAIKISDDKSTINNAVILLELAQEDELVAPSKYVDKPIVKAEEIIPLFSGMI